MVASEGWIWRFGDTTLLYWLNFSTICLVNFLTIYFITLKKWDDPERERVAPSCLTLCNPMDCSLSGSSIHGVFQARVLEWVAISFSRGSFWPRDQTQISLIAGRFFTIWTTRKVQYYSNLISKPDKEIHGSYFMDIKQILKCKMERQKI